MYEIVALVKEVNVTDELPIARSALFNPGGGKVHKAQIKLRFHGEKCDVDDIWSVIGTSDNPQNNTLSECADGSLEDGTCFHFGPVSMDMLFDPIRFVDSTGQSSNYVIPSFDYIHYWRDKDGKNAIDDAEGFTPGTCIDATNSDSYGECLAGDGSGGNCVSDCGVLTPDGDLKECASRDGDEPTFLNYAMYSYTRVDDGDTEEYWSCRSQLFCDSSQAVTFRAISPSHVTTPRNFYTMFQSPTEAYWGDSDPNYAPVDGVSSCDPKTGVCPFSYFRDIDDDGNGHIPWKNNNPDYHAKQWIDQTGSLCAVPSPNMENASPHQMDPDLYMEIASHGTSPDRFSYLQQEEGLWTLPPILQYSNPLYLAPTCFYCRGDDVNCEASPGSDPTWLGSIHGERHFLWEVAPYCTLHTFSPVLGVANNYIAHWDANTTVSNLKSDIELLDLGSDAQISPEDSRQGFVNTVSADGKVAISVSAGAEAGRINLGPQVPGIVVCTGNVKSNGGLFDSSQTAWTARVNNTSPFVDNWEDGCPGCTPLDQEGPGKRALWYTVTNDMLDAFSTDNKCTGKDGSPGSYESVVRSAGVVCHTDKQKIETDPAFLNMCKSGDHGFCRPTNRDSVYTPCYVATAFDQFSKAVTYWRDLGSIAAHRPVWEDYEASKFMPDIYNPYPTPNMWLAMSGTSTPYYNLVWQGNVDESTDASNPFANQPYSIEMTMYVTDDFATSGASVVHAELTWVASQSPCPFGVNTNTVADVNCNTRCPTETDLWPMSAGNTATKKCDDRNFNAADCGRASFFINKPEKTVAVNYFLDYNDCIDIGLRPFYPESEQYNIINGLTEIHIPASFSGIWPAPQTPFELYFEGQLDTAPINPQTGCKIKLLHIVGDAKVQLGSPLEIPSATESSALVVYSSQCLHREGEPYYGQQGIPSTPSPLPSSSIGASASASASASIESGGSGPGNGTESLPDDVGSQTGSCGFDPVCQMENGVEWWQTDVFNLSLLVVAGLFLAGTIIGIIVYEQKKKKKGVSAKHEKK